MSLRIVFLLIATPLIGLNAFRYWRKRRFWNAVSRSLQFIGATMNTVAVCANGFKMPVGLQFMHFGAPGDAHVFLPRDTVRVYWLTDIFPGGSSLGDLFLFFGPLTVLAVYIAAHLRFVKSADARPEEVA